MSVLETHNNPKEFVVDFHVKNVISIVLKTPGEDNMQQ